MNVFAIALIKPFILAGLQSEVMSKRLRSQIDEPLVKLIREFREVVPLNITSDYLIRRGFDEIKSIKELVQNALDENEDVH
ncbi:MAG TPA: hypothetical protein VK487_10395, partial [Candidatus Bathyarchaeia archaeon]|nr:hypothetical protein [Candidatus Bathyarchaeia archaeon]